MQSVNYTKYWVFKSEVTPFFVPYNFKKMISKNSFGNGIFPELAGDAIKEGAIMKRMV